MFMCTSTVYTTQPYRNEVGGWVLSPVRRRLVGGMWYELDAPCTIPISAQQGFSLFAFGGEVVIIAVLIFLAVLTRWKAKHNSRKQWKIVARICMGALVSYVAVVLFVMAWRLLVV